MPGTTTDIRGNAQIEDRRDCLASSRPSYSSHHRYLNINEDRKISQPHSHSDGGDKLAGENQWLQNSNSAKSEATDPDEPPPAYHEAVKVAASSSRPKFSPGLSVRPINVLPRLQLPVIIPQNPREGGFCRAYTPLLGECKVSETAFSYFLDEVDRSAQASPYFSAVNIASIGSLSRPYSTAMIVALARKRYIPPSLLLFQYTKYDAKTSESYRINTFLDRVNAEFFQPRGLFCLIVTWRPDINKTHETVNIEDPIFSASMRSLPFPKAAQLTFPHGDPTENMEPERDLASPNLYGPVSPAFGRGAGIPRLVGTDASYYGSMGYSDPYVMDRGFGNGHGMGGFGGMGGMSMGGHHHGKIGARSGGSGGLIGLAASFIEDQMSSKSPPDPQHYDDGYAPGDVGRDVSSRGSGTKAFKKVRTGISLTPDIPSENRMAN